MPFQIPLEPALAVALLVLVWLGVDPRRDASDRAVGGDDIDCCRVRVAKPGGACRHQLAAPPSLPTRWPPPPSAAAPARPRRAPYRSPAVTA